MNREWWKNLKTQSKIKSYVRPFFFYKMFLFKESFLAIVKVGYLILATFSANLWFQME